MSSHHRYSLLVKGEDLLRVDSVLFQHRVPLQQWRPAQLVSASLARPLLRAGDTLRADIRVLQADLAPYRGQVRAELFSPRGHLVHSRVLQVRPRLDTRHQTLDNHYAGCGRLRAPR